jgi:hypothetical protein
MIRLILTELGSRHIRLGGERGALPAANPSLKIENSGRGVMRRVLLTILAVGVGCVIGFTFGGNPWTVQGQGTPASIAAVPGQVGGQDPFGPYDVATS